MMVDDGRLSDDSHGSDSDVETIFSEEVRSGPGCNDVDHDCSVSWLASAGTAENAHLSIKALNDWLDNRRREFDIKRVHNAKLTRKNMSTAGESEETQALAVFSYACELAKSPEHRHRDRALCLLDMLIKQNVKVDECGLQMGMIHLTDKNYSAALKTLAMAPPENTQVQELQFWSKAMLDGLFETINFEGTSDVLAEEVKARRWIAPARNPLPKPSEVCTLWNLCDLSDDENEEDSKLYISPTDPCDTEGWLNKLGYNRQNWKRRYFTVQAAVQKPSTQNETGKKDRIHLCYWSDDKKAKMVGSVSIKGGKIFTYGTSYWPRIVGFHFGLQPFLNDRTYILEAPTEDIRTQWVSALQEAEGIFAGHLTQSPLEGSIKEGYLEKMGKKPSKKGWRVRYFVLCAGTNNLMLKYYKTYIEAHMGKKAAGQIVMNKPIFDTSAGVTFDREFVLTIQDQARGSRQYMISTSTHKEREEWRDFIVKMMEA